MCGAPSVPRSRSMLRLWTRKAFLSARRNDECAHIGTQMARFAFLSAQDCRFGAHLETLSCVTWRFAGVGSLIIADYSG